MSALRPAGRTVSASAPRVRPRARRRPPAACPVSWLFLDAVGASRITAEAALAWVRRPDADPASSVWARRMTVVRGFARHMSGIDPATEVPPLGSGELPAGTGGRRSSTPPADVEALMSRGDPARSHAAAGGHRPDHDRAAGGHRPARRGGHRPRPRRHRLGRRRFGGASVEVQQDQRSPRGRNRRTAPAGQPPRAWPNRRPAENSPPAGSRLLWGVKPGAAPEFPARPAQLGRDNSGDDAAFFRGVKRSAGGGKKRWARLHGSRGDGPLVRFASGFELKLVGLGYRPATVSRYLGLMGQLNRWLADEGLGVGDLSPARVEEFLGVRRAGRRRAPTLASLVPLLDYLSDGTGAAGSGHGCDGS